MINSERALILAPGGRDGSVATALLRDGGRTADTCSSIVDLVGGLGEGAGLAIITSEALQYADLGPLWEWIEHQPPWSDFPFIILSQRAAVPEQGSLIAELQARLGNVIVLERPFHPGALLNVVGNALRGRRRQYQARRYLEAVREGEHRLQTALLAGRMGAWELDVAEQVLSGSDQFRACFGRGPGEPFLFADLIESVSLYDQGRVQRAFDDAMKTGADVVLDFRVHWPDGREHWIDARARVLPDRHGRPQTLVGVASDITQRKAAEAEREKLLAAIAAERERTQQALRGERALSGLLLTSVPAGIVAYDAELRVTIWNP
ncbi:MAG: domain S-box protein, partial [Devosia sp.]|nr:domain S-box protein [Devosia sp.]